ncbi:type ISP restriction/modification enzyme [Paraurantiacibacter namhicola]|uniref:site-specific DNA-methyltransferase (adenine-specific) n=1 Tax=Paraurantiacibacter namhicola TaxID=645517 RepID=A0A1C7D866_9SPHN|nr:type ISP restriction/modification enzyme [Paraurantiacibacter namhicola]ANU07669.1 N-6 DNA Methylase [Paraurantiacibacter namhicola]
MDIAGYLEEISRIHASGDATEHSYRAPLQRLFESIDETASVINEPKRSEGGMPDFLFHRDGVAFGWAEAKDLPKDVVKLKGYSVEQRKRYEAAYHNLIYTNGVDFEFIREGEVIHHTSIADFMGDLGGLQPLPEKFEELERYLRLFVEEQPISIRSAKRLAEMMANKAAIIKGEVDIALKDDPEFQTTLGRQFKVFKQNLLPNLTPEEFADLYAETITYGMFAARLHDTETPENFSRDEALKLLPKSNPFLRGLFQTIVGFDLPEWLIYAVEDLVNVLRASRPHDLFEDFGKFTARNDPFIHFYETFLAEYNPKKRKARGVWYTPEPVVDFIVRAVDDVLKTEFDIPDGLADTKKVTVDWDTGQDDPKTGKPRTIKREVHRVQILDPATGTGTFLAKTVQTIADRVKSRAPGAWSNYVERDLLPRLHGFELLMASYAMCHMKLDMQLTESGYVPNTGKPPEDWPTGKQWPPRLSVWLTNALEPAEREVKDLFALQALADEARGAGDVKRQTPIMCVIGNPPYSGVSQNMESEFSNRLIEDYKYVDGKHFGERRHWLLDDYVKFIRTSEKVIADNGQGVLAFISNNGFLSNPTFRGMRWHLLSTFDAIHVIDLHGNSNKRERTPTGSPDKNVFDIKQGVSIIIAIKKRDASIEPRKTSVYHRDFWGTRLAKDKVLRSGQVFDNPDNWTKLDLFHPYYFFVPFNAAHASTYDAGFNLKELFYTTSKGVITARDDLAVAFEKSELQNTIKYFTDPSLSDDQLRQKFFSGKSGKKYPKGDTRGWKLPDARTGLREVEVSEKIEKIAYRPFDFRFFFYGQELTDWPREEVMLHVTGQVVDGQHYRNENIAISFNRRIEEDRPFSDALALDCPIQHHSLSIKEANDFASLYRYPDRSDKQVDSEAPTQRTVNFDLKLYAAVCKAAGIDPADQAGPDDDFRKATGDARPSEVKVFDYIYGVLHSPDYRETFAEFLKIDFPRVPYPSSSEVFRHVSEKGEALRRLHLMEPGAIGDAPYPFMPEDVSELEDDERNAVAAAHPKWDAGRVYINKVQYFDGVPQTAWDFHIGGYQPAQKWLKDRKGRALSYEDIGHYQNIVKILLETDRIMREIKLPLDLDAAPDEEVQAG